jgi:hypothetical protein
MTGQSVKATEIIGELVRRVLGRDEEFSLSVRRNITRKFAKDSTQILLPPIEVIF